ncbi:MAG: class I SAM-dependent methyltransferase [Meiothermus sp.]
MAVAPWPETLDTTWLTPTYRADLRTGKPEVFVDETHLDFARLSWKDLGRPYRVENYSSDRKAWEAEHGQEMPVLVQWKHFNRAFHSMFSTPMPQRLEQTRADLRQAFALFDSHQLAEAFEDWLQARVWNKVHRQEDAVWDPRGKRALFEGLRVNRPRILFLGAAEGYEAMQLQAMYPGGEAVLVDYDEFCKTERFGQFPEEYPFLGYNPSTGGWKTYHRADFNTYFVVEDIRNLDFGAEFDIVLSVGLLEHFPDTLKPQAIEWHRKFVRPGGYVILTTPRRQLKSKVFYRVMGRLMNYGYRELMDARQLGKYAHENGLGVLRCGYIKAHNGVVARVR